jgi:hypothetical protein
MSKALWQSNFTLFWYIAISRSFGDEIAAQREGVLLTLTDVMSVHLVAPGAPGAPCGT